MSPDVTMRTGFRLRARVGSLGGTLTAPCGVSTIFRFVFPLPCADRDDFFATPG
jgi:hypothetical protein